MKRLGRWRAPARIVASTGAGTIKLDFGQAVLASHHIVLEARANVGSVILLVPEGWEVNVDGVSPGVGSVRNRTVPPRPGAPVLHVHGHAGLGDVVVRHARHSRWLPR